MKNCILKVPAHATVHPDAFVHSFYIPDAIQKHKVSIRNLATCLKTPNGAASDSECTARIAGDATEAACWAPETDDTQCQYTPTECSKMVLLFSIA